MKVSIYSTCWGMAGPAAKSFDIPGALSNWSVYADEISVACGDEPSAQLIEAAARVGGYPVKVARTSFNFQSDPFAYGKTENAALQACSGDLLIQQNLDERLLVNPQRLSELYHILKGDNKVSAFWVPTMDLYGSVDRYLPPCGKKWYVHQRGLFRGPVTFGLKGDGRPDYNKTSTDELIDGTGNLVPTAALIRDLSLSSLQRYVADGWPITYHLGYLSLGDRLERSIWWKDFWTMATAGDPNKHPTSMAELAARETVVHGLPLWPTKAAPDSALDMGAHI
jgi:hypothetical protein